MIRTARLVLLFSACAAVAVAAQAPPRVTGSITYRERIALPPTAVAEITLEDVSRADARTTTVAELRLMPVGQVPIQFVLPYEAARIDPAHRYAIRARILDGDRVMFTSTTSAQVLTQGHDASANLLLSMVGAAKPVSQAPAALPQAKPAPRLTGLPATFLGTLPCADCAGVRYQLNLFADDSFFLRRTYLGKTPAGAAADDLGTWTLSSDRRVLALKGAGDAVELYSIRDGQTLRKLDSDGGEIKSTSTLDLRRTLIYQPLDIAAKVTGSYRYIADAGTFTECSTGQRWPVAQEAANKDLEAAYRDAKKPANAAVLLGIEGHVVMKPLVDGAGTVATLIVDRVVGPAAGTACAPRYSTAPFENTYWRLTRLGGTPVPAATTPRNEPSLMFQVNPDRFSGASGCNRLTGTYARVDDGLTMQGAGTLMACAASTDTEAPFVAMLKQVRYYRIIGRTLELHDAQHVVLARFEGKTRE